MKIIFVCTGNTCRSPMAEAIFKDLMIRERLDEHPYVVASAGISVIENMTASDNAIAVLKDKGIDISKHRARQLSEGMIREFDLILTMTQGHKNWIINFVPSSMHKVFTIKEYEDNQNQSDISDPYGRSKEAYRKTADELYLLIQKLIKKFKEN